MFRRELTGEERGRQRLAIDVAAEPVHRVATDVDEHQIPLVVHDLGDGCAREP